LQELYISEIPGIKHPLLIRISPPIQIDKIPLDLFNLPPEVDFVPTEKSYYIQLPLM